MVGLLAFIGISGEFVIASVVLTDPDIQTLAVGLYSFVADSPLAELGRLLRRRRSGRPAGHGAVPVPAAVHCEWLGSRWSKGVNMAGNQPHHDGSALYVGSSTPELGQRVTGCGCAFRKTGGPPRVCGSAAFRTPSRGMTKPTVAGDSGGWVWWEATMAHVNPVALYRFVIETGGQRTTTVPLLVSEQCRPAQPGHLRLQRLPGDHRQVPPRHGRTMPSCTRFSPTGLPGPKGCRSCPTPDWGVACDWDTPVQGSGPDVARQFYGGDLDGITEKLDHWQALGADIVYLTPFFPGAPTTATTPSTFMEVDPLLGGDEALVRLVEAAHARGMKVMGDLTSNHTGDAHEWFKRAQADPNTVEASFYYFNEDHTEYESWWGVKSLPKLNWTSAALREPSSRARIPWWRAGSNRPFNLDGWRIDVGNMTGRLGAQNINKEVAALIQDRILEINPNALLLGEETSDAGADVDGFGWQGAMTYSNFTRPLWQWLADPAARVDFFGTPLAGPPRWVPTSCLRHIETFPARFPGPCVRRP